ncbi:MAG: ABC transporter permease [Lachnospiraceae bacterium]|nr:ABC transporter permease [Lachnospiraceae bacterium]
MLHLIKYRFICTMRDRTSMFWAIAFPLMLATLFFFAFSNMGNNNLKTIPVALVKDSGNLTASTFVSFLDSMEKDDSHIIQVERLSEEDAVTQLKENKITGIFYAQETPSLMVASEGMEESILQSLLDSYNRNADMMYTVATEKPFGLVAAAAAVSDYRELVQETTIDGKEVNGFLQYFLALIAMACLYGCFLGFSTALELQANLSSLAIRRSITPTHRLKMVFVDMLVTFAVHFVNVMILLAYLKYILKVDFGRNMGGTVLVCAVGCLIGVALGIFVGSCGRGREMVKVGIMLAVSMVCCFLSGLMIAQMKNMIEQYCPIVNRLNPAALISDALYCMSIYNNPARYGRDMVTLLIMAGVLGLGAFLMVRRERYDSI